jgi:hypothetical protein
MGRSGTWNQEREHCERLHSRFWSLVPGPRSRFSPNYHRLTRKHFGCSMALDARWRRPSA